MTLEDIKKDAAEFQSDGPNSLSDKIVELKERGVSFLGCIAFVQTHKALATPKEARDFLLKLDAYTVDEKKKIDVMHQIMLSEFEEE